MTCGHIEGESIPETPGVWLGATGMPDADRLSVKRTDSNLHRTWFCLQNPGE
jgi:hypothetical protein